MNGLLFLSRKCWVALVLAGFVLACQASDLVITSFGGPGQLVFGALDDGTNYIYRVEWAPTPSGPWRTFRDVSDVLDHIATLPGRSVTSTVPMYYRAVAYTGPTAGMVLIPGGTNSGTNPLAQGEFHNNSYPATYNITVGAYYIDKYLMTKALWDNVRNDPSTVARGYTDLRVGGGQGSDHPVHTVSWYDAVKWLNARSELAGREPVYYTDDVFTQVYRTGNVDETYVKASANGYRLPTMDQWEYAARGGLQSQRFPWGNEIHHGRQDIPDRANYLANGSEQSYDISPYTERTYHPKGMETGSLPFTTPVDYSPANDFGLHDMAGNLQEWNYEWSPAMGGRRVLRGGSFGCTAIATRTGANHHSHPGLPNESFGFRAVLIPVQD